MEVKVFINEKQDAYFYSILGRYFAYREYAKEMGGWQFYNKDNSVWFLLFDGNILLGFCCLFNNSNHIFYDNFYILKQYRGKGYSKILFDFRFEYSKIYNKEIQAIVDSEIQEKNYKRCGFEIYGKRGHYRKWKKKI